MSTDGEQFLNVSLTLQDLAREINTYLNVVADRGMPFVLVVNMGRSAHYLSNVSRDDGMGLLETVVSAWKDKTMLSVSTLDDPEADV
jgi:hypothetical protein